MAKQNIIAALDIGSGKITAVAATTDQQTDTVKILAGGEFVCESISCGTVGDIRAAATAIRNALTYLEKETGSPVCSLYLALRGKNIETYTNRGSITISQINNRVTQGDIKLVTENAQNISLKTGYKILSTVPQAYYINNERITNPEDMSASTLEVDIHITTGLKTTFDNLDMAVERAEDWPITGRAYGLICLAECVLTEQDKDSGVLLVDMGRDTTSAGIYTNGSLICSYDLDFGSNLITEDIAKMLHISRKEAENLKIKYGAAFPNNYDGNDGSEEITIPSPYKEETKITRESLIEIIRPRVENIFETVREKIQSSAYYEFVNAAVLTGGGSLLPGVTETARTCFNKQYVSCSGVQKDLVECEEKFLDPKFATAVSLAYFVAKRQIIDTSNKKEQRRSGGLFSNIGKKIKDLELFGD